MFLVKKEKIMQHQTQGSAYCTDNLNKFLATGTTEQHKTVKVVGIYIY